MNTTANEATQYPSVSIIIATLNNGLTIGECIQSIKELDYPQESVEVMVIDAGSRDSTIDIAKKHQVRLISEPLNAPAAYNYASKIVTGEIIGFIDADAKVEKQWLKKLIPHLNKKNVVAASGTIETWNKERLIPRCIGYDLNYRYSRIRGSVERVATMNLILKKEVMKKIGGFDENLSTQYDTDIGTRMTHAGYKIIVDPETKCYHFHRPTLTQYFKQQLKYGKNTIRLYVKHSHLMLGDEITDWWMNIQPISYATIGILLVVGLMDSFHSPALILSLFLAAAIMLQYSFSAVKVALRYQDPTALALVVIYITRASAWTLGAAMTVFLWVCSLGRAK